MSERALSPSAPAAAEDIAMYIMANDPNNEASKPMFLTWDSIVPSKWASLTTKNVMGVFGSSKVIADLVSNNAQDAADSLICQMAAWDKFINDGGKEKKCKCPPDVFYERDPDVLRDPDDGGYAPLVSEYDLEDTLRETLEKLHKALEERVGKRRTFKPNLGDGNRFEVESEEYINGDNGQHLQRANGNNARFHLVINPDDCDVATLESSGGDDVTVQCKFISDKNTQETFSFMLG